MAEHVEDRIHDNIGVLVQTRQAQARERSIKHVGHGNTEMVDDITLHRATQMSRITPVDDVAKVQIEAR